MLITYLYFSALVHGFFIIGHVDVLIQMVNQNKFCVISSTYMVFLHSVYIHAFSYEQF